MGVKPRKTKKALVGLQSVKKGWSESFPAGAHKLYPCPKCGRGRLDPMKDSFRKEETAQSRADRINHTDEWDGEYGVSRFVGLLICDNKACKEIVAVAGNVHSEREYVDEEENAWTYADVFHPTFLFPAPRLFNVPAGCPQAVADELDRAFAAFWFDLNAAGNSIRCAVELLLTHQKVKRFGKNKHGERYPISLHGRIELWRSSSRRKDLANRLLAVKWIGNNGSHGGEARLQRSDVYDACDLLKDVLGKVFEIEPHERALTHLSGSIVKRKKPRSRHSRS
jgi:hypothetical protein